MFPKSITLSLRVLHTHSVPCDVTSCLSAATETTTALLEHVGTQVGGCREPVWPTEGGAWASDLLLYITDHKTGDGCTRSVLITAVWELVITSILTWARQRPSYQSNIMWMMKSCNHCVLTKTHPQSVVVNGPDPTGKIIRGRQKVSALKTGRLVTN